MSKKLTCQDCRWFVWSDGMLPKKEMGECYRRPPVVVATAETVERVRPIVLCFEQACGEFEALP